MSNGADVNGSKAIVISRGLAWLAGIVVTLTCVGVVPWARMMNSNANQMGLDMAAMRVSMESMKEEMRIMTYSLSSHVTDPAIHHNKLTDLEGRIRALERETWDIPERGR